MFHLPLYQVGTTLGHDRPSRGGGNANANIAEQEFAIRVCSPLPAPASASRLLVACSVRFFASSIGPSVERQSSADSLGNRRTSARGCTLPAATPRAH